VRERLEGLGVAEESADADQPVPPEGVDLVIVALQMERVVPEPVDPMKSHPPFDATQQRVALVSREVLAAANPDEREDPLHLGGGGLGSFPGAHCRRRDTAGVREQPGRNFRHRQDEVGRLRVDRAGRHAVELGRLGVLHDRQAGLGADRREADRAVGSRAGEDDAHGAPLLIAGQGAEEEVDRQRGTTPLDDLLGTQNAAANRDATTSRRHVDVICFDLRLVGDLAHRHVGGLGEDLGEQARPAGSLMAHDHERQAAIRRQRCEELAERRERTS